MKKEQPNNRYGLCPKCENEPSVRNFEDGYYATCDDCKLYWPLDEKLFSGAGEHTTKQQLQNVFILLNKGYDRISQHSAYDHDKE